MNEWNHLVKMYGLNVDTSIGEKTQMNHCVFTWMACSLFIHFPSHYLNKGLGSVNVVGIVVVLVCW